MNDTNPRRPSLPPRPATRLLPALGVVACAALVALGSMPASAQRRARRIPMEGTPVAWTLFIAARDGSPQRGVVTDTAGAIELPGTPYTCRYGAPSRVAMGGGNWSETRSLECQFGTTIVSTSGFCQVSGSAWGARAAVLYLAEEGATERVQVTLDCAVQPASR